MKMNNQEVLFYDSINDALKDVIKHVGGNKAVGQMLWPEISADRVAGKLADCLNDARAEKLSPDQFILLLKVGREVGCHAAINYISREAGYSDPQPVNKEDQKERLQREFIESAKRMNKLAEDLKALGVLNV